MKSGLENKRNVAVLVGLLVILAGAAWYFVSAVFVGGGPPPAAPAAATMAPPPETNAGNAGPAQRAGEAQAGPQAHRVAGLASLDPTLHPEVMAGAESLQYSGTGRNIFSMSSAPPKIEQVKGPVRPNPVQQQQVAQGPPPPPPIDLKFFGYEAAGGARKAFLLHGDDVFIASEGDVVDHHYKVVKINPLSIQITDLLYNNTQTLPLTQS